MQSNALSNPQFNNYYNFITVGYSPKAFDKDQTTTHPIRTDARYEQANSKLNENERKTENKVVLIPNMTETWSRWARKYTLATIYQWNWRPEERKRCHASPHRSAKPHQFHKNYAEDELLHMQSNKLSNPKFYRNFITVGCPPRAHDRDKTTDAKIR